MALSFVGGTMLRKYYPWVVFLGFLLLLAFNGSSYAKAVDSMLWPLRLGVLAGFSALVVWSRWRHRDDHQTAKDRVAHSDSADQLLTSVRRWFQGEHKRQR